MTNSLSFVNWNLRFAWDLFIEIWDFLSFGSPSTKQSKHYTLIKMAPSPFRKVIRVTGAPNVPSAGGKVAWAQPGATLPGGHQIGRKEIRGFSSPGMLCSEVELGIGERVLPPRLGASPHPRAGRHDAIEHRRYLLQRLVLVDQPDPSRGLGRT